MKESGYSIKDLEVLSGIKMHTIRIWEKRYDLLNPHRTDTNIRWYDDSDLKRLLNVSLLTKNGYKISKIVGWNDDAIKETVLKISVNKNTDSDYVNQLLLQMVEMNTAGFIELINEILKKYDIEKAYFNVFFSLFNRVGMYWQVGSIFPAQEHFVTSLLRQKLIAAIDKLEIKQRKNSTMLFFTHENDLHEMGLLFYSYLAQKNGFDVFYLGQAVPFSDLEKISNIKTIDYIFTTFINSISKSDIEIYLNELKNCFPKQKIFISGLQIQKHSPSLPRNVKTIRDYAEFRKYLGNPE